LKLCFWQNIISPHQLPYIRELAEVYEVFLVVSNKMDQGRQAMGWVVSCTGKIKLIVDPKMEEISQLFSNKEITHHVFSGIAMKPLIHKAFRESLRYDIVRGIISEGPSRFRRPLIVQAARTLVFEKRYYSRIEYVFAMGNFAYNWYSFWNKNWNVFKFGYVVETPVNNKVKIEGLAKFAFAGSLIKLKNFMRVVKALSLIEDLDFKVDVFGDGPERLHIEKEVRRLGLVNKMRFHGFINNKDLLKAFQNIDILLLPSLYDGWGAVINEAIMSGMYVICSDRCGAHTLIKNDVKMGKVFQPKNTRQLSEILQRCVAEINEIRKNREYRYFKSKCLKGKSMARYFVDCLKSGDKQMLAPWELD